MHRIISPIPLFMGSRSQNNRSMAHGQSATLSAKEKKYMSNVEKALQAFESVDEWADYISFLGKLQKALLSNPDTKTTNWIPFDFQVSITLAKCISPSLPSGVHRKTIELYSIIFKILQPVNLSGSISLWLPGILPLMSYASISVKPELLNIYTEFICTIEPNILRSCFKSILLSLLPALDDTTSEFFNSTLELIESLKVQLNDLNHFWQCLLLSIITSPDKRIGAMEYLTRKLPSFKISDDKENISKDTILSNLTSDAIACLVPEPGLLIKAFCQAMNDENLFVQRGFFDLLLSRLPLNSAVYQYLISDSDKELLILFVTATVLRKDMSLNRRLWNWLLGPESLEGSTATNFSRLTHFKKYGFKHFLNSLLHLIDTETSSDKNKDQIIDDYIKACRISISIMDKWEIGQTILPHIFIPILQMSKNISDKYPDDFHKIIKYSNELFDGMETIVIWSNILKLINEKNLDLVLFILKSYNVEDEDMVLNHVPFILLSAFSFFEFTPKWVQLIDSLVKIISQRTLPPIDLSNTKYNSLDYFLSNTSYVQSDIIEKINTYYLNLGSVDDNSLIGKPFDSSDLSALYIGLNCVIIINSLKNRHTDIFYSSTKIFDILITIIPHSKESDSLNLLPIRREIENLFENKSYEEVLDTNFSFGVSVLFKYCIKDLKQLEMLRMLKITMKSLWICLEKTNGNYQVEIAQRFWNLEMIVGPSYIEAGLCQLLLEADFEKRISQFNTLWVHFNTDNHESNSILHRPLYLILDELNNNIYLPLILKWIKSTINSSTLNKIFRIVCFDLFNNVILEQDFDLQDDIHIIDFNKIAYELEIIYNLLKLHQDVSNNFKLELCVIDNNKQIDLIKSRNWDISTYKSFLLVVLNKFMEIKPSDKLLNDNVTYPIYLKFIQLSLKLSELLIDGTEINFSEMVISLFQVYQEKYLNKNSSSTLGVINSYYLDTLVNMIKLSSKNQNKQTPIFEISEGRNSNNSSIDLLNFISFGINSCSKTIEFNGWIEFILSTSEYYPALIFQICDGLITCISNKIENEYLINDKTKLIDESICELIIGMEKIVAKCHKHLGYMLSAKFGYSGMSSAGSVKESGFFGSVIQGVFQVEPADEKNEMQKRKKLLIEAINKTISTVYKIWVFSEENLNNFSNSIFNDNKTINFCFNKVKFRCKKLIENNYLMEPLETVESLIECFVQSYEGNLKSYGFKLIQILDDCRQNIILPYILEGIISRVNYQLLEESKRSSLVSTLSETELSLFLIEYCDSLTDNEQIEEVWNDILNFIKDTISNISYYKYIYPNILRFLCIIGNKLLKTDFGKSKRINREISENFVKILNLCISVKIGQTTQEDKNSSSTLQNRDFDINPDVNNNIKQTNGISGKEKIIFREDVCIALHEVIPFMKILINDNDKLITAFNNIINGINTFVFKTSTNNNGYVNFRNLSGYMIDMLIVLSKDETSQNLKIWNNLCQDIINHEEFFSIEVESCIGWKEIMRNWILNDTSKLNDMVNNKLIMSNGTNNSSTLLFNWNDEVDILNGNIPIIKRLTYLILINEDDSFISLIPDLTNKLNDLFKAFKQMTKNCLLEKWCLILLRSIVLKFSENHLINIWTMVNKELFYLFSEVYENMNRIDELEKDNEGNNDKEKMDKLVKLNKEKELEEEEVFNSVFLQCCKLLDVLVILGQEEFQMSEWIFIIDNMDGIYKSSIDSEDVGIVEKISKLRTSYKIGKDGINIGNDDLVIKKKKVPMLNGVRKINNIMDLKKFYSMLKINKYENEYEMKSVDIDVVYDDIFEDVFNN